MPFRPGSVSIFHLGDDMLKLARAITGLNYWIGRTVHWLILPMFAMLLFDVAMRYMVGRPTIWTTELTQLVFGVYAVIGGGWLLAGSFGMGLDGYFLAVALGITAYGAFTAAGVRANVWSERAA